jgi:hypothetical protein
MTTAEKVLTHNPREPRRGRCRCGAEVVRVVLAGGRALTVDHPEASLADELEPGLYVAVDAFGDARPLRWPSERLRNGEAIYSPHSLTCEARDV